MTLSSKKHWHRNQCQLHQESLSGLSSYYCPRLMLLNYKEKHRIGETYGRIPTWNKKCLWVCETNMALLLKGLATKPICNLRTPSCQRERVMPGFGLKENWKISKNERRLSYLKTLLDQPSKLTLLQKMDNHPSQSSCLGNGQDRCDVECSL